MMPTMLISVAALTGIALNTARACRGACLTGAVCAAYLAFYFS